MDNITSLEQKFATFVELKEYADAQYRSLLVAQDKIKQLVAEVDHLKQMLAGAVPLVENSVEQIIRTPEEAICVAQIRILAERAMNKELTLEETKRLDLLVKNLNVIRNNNPSTFDGKKKTHMSEAELISIAHKKEKNNDQ